LIDISKLMADFKKKKLSVKVASTIPVHFCSQAREWIKNCRSQGDLKNTDCSLDISKIDFHSPEQLTNECDAVFMTDNSPTPGGWS
jgi:hypothetical protein